MASSVLHKCFHCGGDAELKADMIVGMNTSSDAWKIVCKDCGMNTGACKTMADAILVWENISQSTIEQFIRDKWKEV